MNVEEQRKKMMELADDASNQPSADTPSTFIQAKEFANEELNEIISEMEKLMKKFERSEVFKTFGKKYVETILSSKEQFARVLNNDISQEEFRKLSPDKQAQVKRQQQKRRELLKEVAKSYGII